MVVTSEVRLLSYICCEIKAILVKKKFMRCMVNNIFWLIIYLKIEQMNEVKKKKKSSNWSVLPWPSKHYQML